MATRVGPRSATDATRFTSTTPQPRSKASATKAAGAGGPGHVGETLEQRMQRLRAAHLAARNAPVSTYERIVGGSRRIFDAAHKVTIMSIVFGTAVAGIFSIYAVYDMVKYNRKRRDDFIEAQRHMEDDELSKARLAFLNGTATEEQVRLVEYALKDAEQKGLTLPPLLSAPGTTPERAKEEPSLFQQIEAQVQAAEAGGVAHAAKMEEMRRKVKDAFKKEKESQRQGGMLDQIGLETAQKPEAPAKKSGWKFW